MQLGVFTPVSATLPFPEMIDAIRALRHVTALELGTGGWPGGAHLDLDALRGVPDPGCADLPAARRRRRPDDQRPVVPRQPAAPRRRRARPPPTTVFRKTVRAGRTAGRAGRRHLLRLPRRLRRRAASQLGHDALAAGVSRRARLAMGRRRHSVLDDAAAFAADHGREGGARSPPGLSRLQRRHRAEAARRGGTEPRRQLRPEPLLLAGRGLPAAIRALGDAIFHVHAKDVALDPANVAVNGVLDTKSYRRHGGAVLAVPHRRLGPRRARHGSRSSARCASRATTT